MQTESDEYRLFSKAVSLTKEMISLMSETRNDYLEVTQLMMERGTVYKELDLLIKTLDRSNLSDKENVKLKYDELFELDTEFRNLLKTQSDRLRNKSSHAEKDKYAHSSYNQPKKPKESMFFSSKLEG